MINTSTFSDILASIKTTFEAEHALSQIDILLRHLYTVESGTPDEILSKYLSHSFALDLSKTFQAHGVSWQDPKSTKDLLLSLKISIQSLPVLKIALAFLPDSHAVSIFSARVRADLGSYIILDFSYDPSIMGGAILSFQGHYKDITLKKRIADAFEKKRESILSLIQT